jgi:hypothetical protein
LTLDGLTIARLKEHVSGNVHVASMGKSSPPDTLLLQPQ